jgi:hypothetical protein
LRAARIGHDEHDHLPRALGDGEGEGLFGGLVAPGAGDADPFARGRIGGPAQECRDDHQVRALVAGQRGGDMQDVAFGQARHRAERQLLARARDGDPQVGPGQFETPAFGKRRRGQWPGHDAHEPEARQTGDQAFGQSPRSPSCCASV